MAKQEQLARYILDNLTAGSRFAMRCLIIFAQAHNEFRLPELSSVAELNNFKVTLPENIDDRDPTRPYMVVELEEEEHARILAKRCILIKSVCFNGQQQCILTYGFILDRCMNSTDKPRIIQNSTSPFGHAECSGSDTFPILASSSLSPRIITRSRNLVRRTSWRASPTWAFWARLT